MRINFTGSGFTRNTSERPLCDTCSRCQKMVGTKLDHNVTFCKNIDKPINFPVYECSSYNETTRLALYDMERIAWSVGKDKKTGLIGFYNRDEFTKRLDDGKLEKVGTTAIPDGVYD